MPKVKTLLITVLVIAFALSLTGCGMLLSRRAEPELAASLDGELPEWLLLSHRSEETFEADDVTNLKDPADEEEEEETAMGGVDEDDGVTAPSSNQTASPPPPAPPPASSSSSNNPPAGTREYMAWFAANNATGTFNPLMVTWYIEHMNGVTSDSYEKWKVAYDKKQSSGGDIADFWDPKHSPSNFGND